MKMPKGNTNHVTNFNIESEIVIENEGVVNQLGKTSLHLKFVENPICLWRQYTANLASLNRSSVSLEPKKTIRECIFLFEEYSIIMLIYSMEKVDC